ncbi:MAG: sugar porter family MFS transporter [Mixta calida]|uniref:sugar porter family MFS transporter n=2 Tax=Erwiniaceae TaxID=1903409 RepID=UPI00168135B0|nr:MULTISPECIES: sugar porter family MFS transporter [Mixta]MDU3817985.1 sugar porter family MFS transporter [Pantoea sp.]MCR1567623.1 sugar porter family MFS transporter [Mixta sp.]MDU3076076.1 sugar porter family MFS transporter [Mixta calida]MDU5828180.1 sugar porter family MFS transporter [Mixta calida]MDU6414051.1 sugar porter family MFS transporter [Mixta calida]
MSVSQTRHNIAYVMGICCVAALGGLLLGYDSSVISGAIEPLSHHYQLSPAETGWAVSNVIIGCVVGCLIAGQIADRYGRKKTLLVTALLFVASVAGTALAPEFEIFVLFRMIGGLGIGMASVVSPVYIAEVAPKDYRGRAMTMHMICCVGGQVLVLLTNYLIVRDATPAWLNDAGWRWMLGSAFVPCLLFFLFISFIPESPRWNVMAGHDDRALKTLTRISSAAHAENVLREIKTSLRSETHATHANERLRFNKRTLIFLVIGVGLALFNQLTGINVIQYFGPSLLRNVTGSMEEAMFMTIWLAVMQFVGVIVGMALIDRVGRTRLLSVGSWGAALCLILTFISFYSGMKGVASVIGLFGFMFIFGATWAQVVWTVIGEIFPTRLRAAGMGFSISAMWTANFLVSQSFPMMNENPWLTAHFGGGFPLLIFAVCCLISWWFVRKYLPETKGVALENMERLVLGHFALTRRKEAPPVVQPDEKTS